MKKINLLVCLSPKIPSQAINELTFYNIISPYSLVFNVRVVSLEGQVKAFVQVKDEAAAVAVISAINGQKTSIGKVKVFISNKKFINYEKTLHQIIDEVETSNLKNIAVESKILSSLKHNTTSSSHGRALNDKLRNDNKINQESDEVYKKETKVQDNYFKDSFKNSCNSSHNKNVYDLRANTSEQKMTTQSYMIKVSSDDPLKLRSRVIVAYFSRFGSILKSKLNSTKNVWTIWYETQDAMNRAIEKLNKCHIVEYKLLAGSERLIRPSIDCNNQKSVIDTQNGNDLYCNEQNLCVRNTLISDSLKIFDTCQRLTLKEVCKFISNQYLPIRVFEAFDLRDNSSFFLVSFRTCNEAFNAFNQLNANRDAISNIGLNFVDIETHCV